MKNSTRFIAIFLGLQVATVVVAPAQTSVNPIDTLKVDPNLSKVVHVVTEYEPSVSDAFKINELPQVEDTMTVKPTFTYSIVSSPAKTNYDVTPINPAKMKGEPLTRLYKTLLSAGLGNYTTTFANLQASSIRSNKYEVTTELNHLGSFGKVKVQGDREPAGTSNNFVKVAGKKFLDNQMVLYGSINGTYNTFHRYGKDTLVDTTFNGKDIAKSYSYLNLMGGLKTLKLDSGRLNYDVTPTYDLFRCSNKYIEHNLGLEGLVEKNIDYRSVSAIVQVNYHNFSSNGKSLSQTTEFGFNPWFNMTYQQLKLKAGISVTGYSGNIKKVYLYPDLAIDYNLVDNIVIPYVTYNGYSRWSGITSLSLENPFIMDGLYATPENYRNNVTGGIRGSLSKSVPFNVYVRFSDVKNMHFFVNEYEGTKHVMNTFNLVYDDATVMNFHGELGIMKLEKVKCTIKADYFSYNVKNLPQAWHKPSMQTGLNVWYSMQDKIILNFDLFFVGERKAQSFLVDTTTTAKLKGYLDANLGIEYRYTKILSAFVRFNNIAAQNYAYWNLYAVQRFNLLFGVTYALFGE